MSGDPAIRLTFTPAALAKLREVIQDYPEDVAGLRLKIVGRQADTFEHVLTIVEQGYEPEGDLLVEVDDLTVFVEGDNAAKLDGIRIHYEFKGPNVSGLEFDNPNPVWDDPVAATIQRIFDEEVNPAIASHGGVITLLDYQDGKAYIEMGGGCAGCGMADVTLKQGVEVALREAVPELQEVIDTTDHAAGDNPYYKPSKK